MKWKRPEPILIPDSLQQIYDDSPFLAEALLQRGLTSPSKIEAYLDYKKYKPTPPIDLPGVQEAAARIHTAIQEKERIGIWGDFDVDGQTSTTLLVSFFRRIDLDVKYHIPIRAVESHGIQVKHLQDFLQQGIDLLITCDTGIGANDALQKAKELNVDVIVTDHHTPPETLPPAAALINPHFVEADHPFSDLSGVGTAFLLTKQVAMDLGISEEWVEESIDLVALGTVADVSPLKQENRYLVQYGLDRMRKEPRLAIAEMLKTADQRNALIDEQTIGFTLAPRLNALGRLGDANPIVEFLLTNDLSLARKIAIKLEGLNGERKLLVKQVYQAALQQIEKDTTFDNRSIIILWNMDWPAGILGIVANHLVTQFGKPAILLTKGRHDSLKGSARSIPSVNITNTLERNGKFLNSFGGHAMAAGLSLDRSQIDDFIQQMNADLLTSYTADALRIPLNIDSYQKLDDVEETFLHEVEKLAPFGSANPVPIFLAENLKIIKDQHLDQAKNHRTLRVESSEGKIFDVKWWHAFENPVPATHINLAYSIHRNFFRGKESIQIEWVDAKPSKQAAKQEPIDQSLIKTLDYRNEFNQREQLEEFIQSNQAICWGENLQIKELDVYDRFNLQTANSLALLQTPPDARTLRLILKKVNPQIIAFFEFKQNAQEAPALLEQLLGLIKFAIRKRSGEIDIATLAARLGTSEPTIKKALEYLQARGVVSVTWRAESEATLQREGKSFSKIMQSQKEQEFITALRQNEAFKRYLNKLSTHRIMEDFSTRTEE